MPTRDELQGLAVVTTRAYRAEMDAIARLSLIVKKLSFLTYTRADEAGKLSRQLANPAIGLDNASVDKRVAHVVNANGDKELADAYEELMRAIELLPVASRAAAVAALRAALDGVPGVAP